MTSELRPGERLDDLQIGGLELIQDPKKFCFGVDAVFLSDFVRIRERMYWIWEPGTASYQSFSRRRRRHTTLQGLRSRRIRRRWRGGV